jgi:hypothetical protein
MTPTDHGELPTAAELSAVRWRTSTRSTSGGGNCVELGPLPGPVGVAIRDSKNRDGGVLVVADASWSGFLGEVKRGGFDLR